jgi:UDP-GlcNAc:undecaprenyl-phosphate GlcNAc-1-phosphate transferase
VAQPVPDRWHRKATPLSGGFAIITGFLIALTTAVFNGEIDRRFGYVALGGAAAFLLGLGDDRRRIGPREKFVGQLAIATLASVVIRPHWIPAAAAVPLAIFVLVAAMNSFNLLDNMDGLAAGTAVVAAGTLAAITALEGGSPNLFVACAVVGAALGFLPLNYRLRRPAALFMGDSGALFLGFVVGALALLAGPHVAGGTSAAVIAPLLILALPILDTSLVILVRLVEGRPIWAGGCDHLSHRLVYLGFGEREAVAVLLCLAASSGGAAVLIVAIDDPLATGAALGGVFALLVAIASRLVLVRDEQVSALVTHSEPEFEPATVREHAQIG